jgi:surfactin synthase thioesterase subunit
MDAAANYVPLPYPGPIVVFWPEEDPESVHDVLKWWKKVSPHAELETVPGNHLAGVTVYAKVFARRLAARLPV